MKIREVIVENSLTDVIIRAKKAIVGAMSNAIFSKAVEQTKNHQDELVEIKKQLEQMTTITKKNVVSLVLPLATKVAREIKPSLNEDVEAGGSLGALVGGLLGIIVGTMQYGIIGFLIGPVVGVVACAIIGGLIGGVTDASKKRKEDIQGEKDRADSIKRSEEYNKWAAKNPEAHAENVRRQRREQKTAEEKSRMRELWNEFNWLDNQPEWNLTRAQQRRHDELANYLGVKE